MFQAFVTASREKTNAPKSASIKQQILWQASFPTP
jgi:hypothetical protein